MNYTSVLLCEVLFSFAARPCVLSENLALLLCDFCSLSYHVYFAFLVPAVEHGGGGGRVKHMWPEVNKSGGLIVCACDNTSVGVIYGSVYA